MSVVQEKAIQEFPLNGFFRPRLHAPGFAIPIFSFENSFWVQVISKDRDNEQELVTDFRRTDVNVAYIVGSTESYSQSLSKPPLYAFRFPNGSLCMGTRKTVQDAIRDSWTELENHPFVLWDCAEFLQDEQLEEKARMRAESLLTRKTKIEEQAPQVKESVTNNIQEDYFAELREQTRRMLSVARNSREKAQFHLVNPSAQIFAPKNIERSHILAIFESSSMTFRVAILDEKIHNLSAINRLWSNVSSAKCKLDAPSLGTLWNPVQSSRAMDILIAKNTEILRQNSILQSKLNNSTLSPSASHDLLRQRIGETRTPLVKDDLERLVVSLKRENKSNCLVVSSEGREQRVEQGLDSIIYFSIKNIIDDERQRYSLQQHLRRTIHTPGQYSELLKYICVNNLTRMERKFTEEIKTAKQRALLNLRLSSVDRTNPLNQSGFRAKSILPDIHKVDSFVDIGLHE